LSVPYGMAERGGRRESGHGLLGGESDMTEEPTSKLDKLNKLMWLISGIVTAILVVVIMIIIMVRGSGY
jgi:hypothetical protein